jgi:hypothetical protein
VISSRPAMPVGAFWIPEGRERVSVRIGSAIVPCRM